MKHILSLDGGGIRGVFTLEVLLKIETLLREQQYNNSPDFVLRDHFDFFAGTSTRPIIAALLCWGMPVGEIRVYTKHGRDIFRPIPWHRHPIKRLLYSRFDSQPLAEMLQRLFSENGTDAKLGASRLRRMDMRNEAAAKSETETLAEGEGKFLLLVVRNHSTGSSWPLTNNPHAKFNKLKANSDAPTQPDSLLRFPLWQLVRASTAAPTYFDPEEIVFGRHKATIGRWLRFALFQSGSHCRSHRHLACLQDQLANGPGKRSASCPWAPFGFLPGFRSRMKNFGWATTRSTFPLPCCKPLPGSRLSVPLPGDASTENSWIRKSGIWSNRWIA